MPYQKWMRVLDALNWIAENAAPDLAYRWFCGSKMCGTCARPDERPRGAGVLGSGRAGHDDRAAAQSSRHSRSGGRPHAYESKVASLEPWLERHEPYAGISGAAQSQADEGRLEGARLHQLHVLLLGLSGDRARRSHRLRRPGAAGSARPDRARSAQRSREGRALAGADRHFQLRVLLQMRGSLPRQHPDRQPDHRAAEGKGRAARSRHGQAFLCACATSWPRAAGSIPAHWCCACRACARWRNMPRLLRLLVRGKINPLKTLFKIKTAAARGRAAAFSAGEWRNMKFAYYPGCSARSTCAELNEATHLVAAKLGLELLQLESATCTGARELRAIDPVGFYTLNVRILALAESHGLPLMTICNTCTLNVLDAHAAFVSDRTLRHRSTPGSRKKGCTTAAAPASAISSGCCTRTSASSGCANWWSIR